ncbi:hypothetical protein, partial [Phocaeicola vulgatus]|uniref:hypothetical protein n=1 Tax=Phocaeicola vulgatus TaxID=821 RepID=UPI00321A9EDE
ESRKIIVLEVIFRLLCEAELILEYIIKRQQVTERSEIKKRKRLITPLSKLDIYKQNSFFNLCTVLTLTPSSLDTIFIG